MKSEPVLLTSLIPILTAVGAAFGLDLTREQIAGAVAVAVAIAAVIARSKVSPTR